MRNSIKYIFIITVLFLACNQNNELQVLNAKHQNQNQILMQPYLQGVSTSGIYIMVESNSKKSIIVKYGTNKKLKFEQKTSYYVSTTKSKDFIHRIHLQNLESGTKYYYQVSSGVYKSGIYSFYTAFSPGKAIDFAVMGDNRSNPGIFNFVCKETKKRNPKFSIYLGDICYNPRYTLWKKEFFTKDNLNLISEVPFFNAIGNHEGWTKNTKAFLQSPSKGKSNEPYYSFDNGDVHFLILNTELGISKNSKQYKFIQNDLANTKRKWKIVAFHIPAYCAGGHGESKTMIKVSKELFEPNKVDITLTGHSHFYQHNLVNGIHHFVLGGAGAPMYSPGKKDYTIKSLRSYHYVIFNINSNKLQMKVYDIYGKIIDKLDLEKK